MNLNIVDLGVEEICMGDEIGNVQVLSCLPTQQ